MLAKVAAFEIKYQLKSPFLWIAAAFIFVLPFASMSFDLVDAGPVYVNAPYATLYKYLVFSVFFLFVGASSSPSRTILLT